MAPRLSVVVPCYNEEAVLPETVKRLSALLDDLVAEGQVNVDSRVYFVDDGSSDRTWQLIEGFSKRNDRVAGIKLSRNRGHQQALMAGLLNVPGDLVLSIDADLQDDLGAIRPMLEASSNGADIVLGVRVDRSSDTFFKRSTAQLYYDVLKWLGVEIVYNHADYRMMRRRSIEALRQFDEANLFLRALIPQLGFKTAIVMYDRFERFAGESKYPLRKMISLAIQGITSFSTSPLRAITILGLLVSFGSFVLGIWALISAAFFKATVPGWASTVVPIYLVCGVQMLCLGIIGEYIGKIYMETKRRPRFIIEQQTHDLIED